MEDSKILTISELLCSSSPLTASSSLHSSYTIPSTGQSIPHPTSTFHCPNSSLKILSPLAYPAVLVGILSLPTFNRQCPNNNCLCFSDDSSSICCDVLDFILGMIGKKIRVLSCNFIPYKRSGGLLEIIRWEFVDLTAFTSLCSTFDPVPLVSGSSPGCKNSSKARFCVRGSVESVSPITVVPCSKRGSDAESDGCGSSNLRGFLVQFLVCECKLCNYKELVKNLHSSIRGQEKHSFSKPTFVYFCGSTSFWHPVITKLIGDVVILSSLRKKLVFIGKEESVLMYVTTEKCFLHVSKLFNRCLPSCSGIGNREGVCGMYTGIVKGVYMKGMVLELDEEVWFLLTDPLFTPPHSLRVGSIISVRHVHFVKTQFSCAKVLILGACVKTSIIVKWFSPFETRCYMISQSRSLLGKFIESLAFSARLWILLVVSCFRRTFSGMLSEKEILGSIHKEGLVQKYARTCLPPSVFQPRHGIFTEFCKHDSHGCGGKSNYDNLKLVVPIANFVHHSEVTWKKTLNAEKPCKVMGDNKEFLHRCCEGRSYNQSFRKVFSSLDLRTVLVGRIKIFSSGRLQLVDATGVIDIIVPDLPSNWNEKSIYEVNDYTLVMEGIPEREDLFGPIDNKPLSCRSLFGSCSLGRKMNVTSFIYFNLQKASCRNPLLHPFVECEDDLKELEDGTFDLLLITHKFPLLQKFGGNLPVSSRSSMFAEAIVLPWKLFLATAPAMKFSSIRENFSGSMNDLPVPCTLLHEQLKCCNLSSPLEISYFLSRRCHNNISLVGTGLLYCSEANKRISDDFKWQPSKVLLEFKSESFPKYQFLQIGGYYIVKHFKEDSSIPKELGSVSGAQVIFNSRMQLWRFTFSSDKHFSYSNLSPDPPEVECHTCNTDASSRISCQNEVSDVVLHLSPKKFGALEVDLKVLEEGLIKLLVPVEELSNCSSVETSITVSVQPTGCNSCSLLPEGNLVSLHGCVISVHSFERSQNLSSLPLLKSSQGVLHSTCIHLLVGHDIVRIIGTLNKEEYPVGLGPGANATFYRVLRWGMQKDFKFVPVSYIAINSIEVVNDQYSGKYLNPRPMSIVANTASFSSVSSGLFFELNHCLVDRPTRFRCRIATLHILVLESKGRKHTASQTKPPEAPDVNIPLASFILDDGSSPCCCWASADRAASLLRLHEKVQLNASGGAYSMPRTGRTAFQHVEGILNKHGRITVKNYGSLFDSSCQDLAFAVGSDSMIGSSDENLLKLVILNACCSGSIWDIDGDLMDMEAVGRLEKCMGEMGMPMHSMKNVRVSSVSHANPLNEARNILNQMPIG